MNTKKMAVLLAIIAVVAVSIPMVATDSDATIDENGILIKVIGYPDGSVSIDVPNAETETVLIYVTNTTSDFVVLTPSTTDGADSRITTDQSFYELYAEGSSAGLNTIRVEATISVNQYAGTHTETDKLTLKFESVTSGSVFNVTIPFTINIESTNASEDSYNKFFGIIPNTFAAPLDQAWFAALATLVCWIVIAFVATHLLIPVFMKLVGNKKSDTEKKKLRNSMDEMVTALVFVITINECLLIIGTSPELCATVATWSNVIYVIIGAAMAWILYKFIITAVLESVDENVDVDGLDKTLIPLFKMIGKLIIAVVAVASILASFGVDLGGILVSAGVVSLGITLGAQSTLQQFFSGVVLLATRPFRKGDFVKINDEVYIVRKVKLMFTEFDNWDGDQIITMPNNMVASGTIVNMSKDSKDARIFVYMSVAYEADQTLAKELMIRAAKMHPHVILDETRAGPNVRLTNFLDSGIEYRLACYIDDFDNSGHYAGQIREIIYKLFLDNDVEIPYNKLSVFLSEPCDGKKKESDNTSD